MMRRFRTDAKGDTYNVKGNLVLPLTTPQERLNHLQQMKARLQQDVVAIDNQLKVLQQRRVQIIQALDKVNTGILQLQLYMQGISLNEAYTKGNLPHTQIAKTALEQEQERLKELGRKGPAKGD